MTDFRISLCTHVDFTQILADVEDFWGSDRTLTFHHPMFFHEFGDTAFVIKDGERVLAYLFGFISQRENAGYVHLIGVRQSEQGKGYGRLLYGHFIDLLRARGLRGLKAVTTPTNRQSIGFHLKIGMKIVGTAENNGVQVVKDYSGPGQDRVVFRMEW